jgi:hypothetical protein
VRGGPPRPLSSWTDLSGPSSALVGKIDAEHETLEHDELAIPDGASTDPRAALAFVGLNPGGHKHKPSRSVEEGNAFRVAIEGWGPNGGESTCSRR